MNGAPLVSRYPFGGGRRRAPASTLLLRPAPPGHTRPWDWLVWRDGEVLERGAWPVPDQWRGLSCALVVPAPYCSHFDLPAPPGLKRHEWPLLLEERLLQPVESLVIACIGRRDRHLRLVAVERALISHWQNECAARGLQPRAWWSEFQLLPEPAPGEPVVWNGNGYACLKRVEADGVHHWLAWPRVLGELPPNEPAPAYREVTEGGPLPVPAAGLPARLASLVDSRRPSQRRDWPAGRRLLGLCASLALCWGVLLAWQEHQQGQLWQARLGELLGPLSSPRQAEVRLAQMQRQHRDWQFRQRQLATLSGQVGRWLQDEPGWQVRESRFDGRHWQLTLSGHGSSLSRPEPWHRLGEAAGATAVLEVQAQTLSARFDLGAGDET